MARKKRDTEGFNLGDIGNFELPNIDTSLFDVLNDEYGEETRYIKPKVASISNDFV